MQIGYATLSRMLDCRTTDELSRVINAFAGEFQASAWMYAFETEPPGSFRRWLGDYPAAWVDHYQRQGYPEVDPTVQHVWHHSTPFVWPDYRTLPRDQASIVLPENKIFLEAHEYGLNGGITIPLHRGVRWGLLSLSFARDADEQEANRRMMELFFVAHHVHEAGLRLMTAAATRSYDLSPIEIECLRLAAEGVTTDEMAVRTNRKVRAITEVFEGIFRKLNVRSRAAAVALAIRTGSITI